MSRDNSTKVLYVTRKFPPSVGGMEKAAYELHHALKEILPVRLISYGGSNKLLPVVYPWLFIRALLATATWRPDVIYLQDGVMAPMGFMLRLLTRKPIVMSVHGLEVTFENKYYKAIMKRMMPKVQRVVVGSTQTEAAVLARYPGIPLAKVTYGVRDTFYKDEAQKVLRERLGELLDLGTKAIKKHKILVTTGRLVQRKGVAWFVDNVMPQLAAARTDVHYFVAGKGPDEARIAGLIQKHKLSAQVHMLGYISDDIRNLLYNTADYFVMPNIPVPKDMEGFGLVAVEAASCGTPVIASGIEGIIDAVVDGKTGLLLPANDAGAYVKTFTDELTKSSFNRAEVREAALTTYSWRKAAEGYRAVFEQVIRKK